MKKYSLILCSFLILLISLPGFAQRKEANSGFLRQESMKFTKYADIMDAYPVFSDRYKLYLDSAMLLIPKDINFLKTKAMFLFKEKKYELGMDYLDSAIKIDKTTECLEYRAFIRCIFQKNYRESLQDFDKLVKLNGNAYVMDHPYEFYMGLCYLQLNQFEKAEKLFSNCVENDKIRGEDWINPSHWFYLGISFYAQGYFEKAIPFFDNSLKLFPNFPEAKFYKAISLFQLNELASAVTLLKDAQSDYKLGYTIPETNTIYEVYPYQINKFFLENLLKQVQSVKEY